MNPPANFQVEDPSLLPKSRKNRK